MDEYKVGANETTTVALLRYYTLADHRRKFHDYNNGMTGQDGHGLELADLLEEVTPENKHQFVMSSSMAATSYLDYCIFKRKLVQKAPMNHEIYSALIIGMAKFSNAMGAVDAFECMVRAGSDPDSSVYLAMLRCFICLRD